MKILNKEDFDGKVIVTIEEYPGASPVVEAGLTDEEIITKLTTAGWGHPDCPYSWEELVNGASWNAPVVKTVSDITEVLEDNTLHVLTSVMAENFYTESKVIDPTKDYTKIFDKTALSSKETHKNKKTVNGKTVLDLESRIVDLEGALAEAFAMIAELKKNPK